MPDGLRGPGARTLASARTPWPAPGRGRGSANPQKILRRAMSPRAASSASPVGCSFCIFAFICCHSNLKGRGGALSEGGSRLADQRNVLSVTELLSSLQCHGEQEEGNCPAGKPQRGASFQHLTGVGGQGGWCGAGSGV